MGRRVRGSHCSSTEVLRLRKAPLSRLSPSELPADMATCEAAADRLKAAIKRDRDLLDKA